jgi:DNA polymerase I-like protein with 3'-5' exonuclease and polymerase domains
MLPMFTPDSDWRLPVLDELPDWPVYGRVGLDTETYDPDLEAIGPGVRRRGSYVVGASFAIEDGPAAYLPVRHHTGLNLPPAKVFAYLRRQAALFRGTLVLANGPYDLDWLAEEGVEFHEDVRFADVQNAEACIWELHKSYGLDACLKRHGLPGKDKALLREAARAFGWRPKKANSDAGLGKYIARMPPPLVGPYGEYDAASLLPLLKRQERRLEDAGLWDVWNLECDVLPIAVAMTRRGVLIDESRLDEVAHWALAEEARTLKRIKGESGVELAASTHDAMGDIWTAAALVKVFEAIGVELPKTPKSGQPSVKAEVLKSIEHPVAEMVGWARRVSKLRSTFCGGIAKRLVRGRIHCTFNQMKRDANDGRATVGARTGRFSAADPNLQQMIGSKNPELAEKLRACFVPDHGRKWIAADYSQQEPRIAVHLADELGIATVAPTVQKYLNDEGLDFHTATCELIWGTREELGDGFTLARRNSKDIFLGRMYGMGPAKFCHKAGLATKWVRSRRLHGKMIEVAGPEGEALIGQFNAGVPWVHELVEEYKKMAARDGYVVTILGRHVHFPPLGNGEYDWIHKALNGAVQGSGGDQTKKGMVVAHRAGHPLQLTEHDELDESGDEEMAAELKTIMEDCVPMRVPSKVNVTVGASWACGLEK